MNRKKKILRKSKSAILCATVLCMTLGPLHINAGDCLEVPKPAEIKETVIEYADGKEQQKMIDEEDLSIIASKDWDEKDGYLLAKIAMAEAEGEDVEGKALVMLVVLNRVWSDSFPDTVEEVIFQKNQFSPITDGRWGRVEPNEECWEALRMVQYEHWDESQGALYFESLSDSTWHRENLEYLLKHGCHYFYAEKE